MAEDYELKTTKTEATETGLIGPTGAVLAEVLGFGLGTASGTLISSAGRHNPVCVASGIVCCSAFCRVDPDIAVYE